MTGSQERGLRKRPMSRTHLTTKTPRRELELRDSETTEDMVTRVQYENSPQHVGTEL